MCEPSTNHLWHFYQYLPRIEAFFLTIQVSCITIINSLPFTQRYTQESSLHNYKSYQYIIILTHHQQNPQSIMSGGMRVFPHSTKWDSIMNTCPQTIDSDTPCANSTIGLKSITIKEEINNLHTQKILEFAQFDKEHIPSADFPMFRMTILTQNPNHTTLWLLIGNNVV